MNAIYGPRYVWFAAKKAVLTKKKKDGRYYRTYGKIGTFYGIVVFRSAPKMNYGFSNWLSNPTNRVHVADSIYFCWFGGDIICSFVRWSCGSLTPHFQLINAQELPTCERCIKKISAEHLPQHNSLG